MADGTVQLYFGRNYGGIGIMVYGSRRNGVLRMTCFLKVLGDMPKILAQRFTWDISDHCDSTMNIDMARAILYNAGVDWINSQLGSELIAINKYDSNGPVFSHNANHEVNMKCLLASCSHHLDLIAFLIKHEPDVFGELQPCLDILRSIRTDLLQ
jgi:hypothetical protein